MIRLLEGDCRETLPTLEAGSVQCCVTSPPYYGLRDYGLPPLVWGDWSGSLGLEPTPELFIEHIVECFRHVRRVLRDDGTLWLNLGDSYAGSGKGPSNSISNSRNNPAYQAGTAMRRQGFHDAYHQARDNQSRPRWPAFAKPKDLMMMPARVAMALQADGWWLRSMIPWLKRNSMPESVTDRPATAVEYVFLLSKSARYYWDADAVRVPHHDLAGPPSRFGNNGGYRGKPSPDGLARGDFEHHPGGREYNPAGRSRRNSDWFFESWQGLLLDSEDDSLALVVNPQPFKESHFATFPPRLVEPMVKAGTSEKGCCPECGAPWRRITETEYVKSPVHGDGSQMRGRLETTDVNGWAGMPRVARRGTTTGWQPTCAHNAEPVPCTVLDPFGGSGTVGLVADRLGRNAVLCELKLDYKRMAVTRVQNDAPLFVKIE